MFQLVIFLLPFLNHWVSNPLCLYFIVYLLSMYSVVARITNVINVASRSCAHLILFYAETLREEISSWFLSVISSYCSCWTLTFKVSYEVICYCFYCNYFSHRRFMTTAQATEQAHQRREARDTRQDKRQSKQDGRQEARDIKY